MKLLDKYIIFALFVIFAYLIGKNITLIVINVQDLIVQRFYFVHEDFKIFMMGTIFILLTFFIFKALIFISIKTHILGEYGSISRFFKVVLLSFGGAIALSFLFASDEFNVFRKTNLNIISLFIFVFTLFFMFSFIVFDFLFEKYFPEKDIELSIKKFNYFKNSPDDIQNYNNEIDIPASEKIKMIDLNSFLTFLFVILIFAMSYIWMYLNHKKFLNTQDIIIEGKNNVKIKGKFLDIKNNIFYIYNTKTKTIHGIPESNLLEINQ